MSRHEWRVWLQTVGAVFIPVVIIASSSHASVGQAPPGQAQTPPLRGITKVTTLVAVALPEGKARPFDLTEDRLRTILELRLRTAGLRVLSHDEDRADPHINPYVYLSVTVLEASSRSGARTGYVFSTDLSVRIFQRVTLNGSMAASELWKGGLLNITDTEGITPDLERVVGLLLDQLLNEWLAANPPPR